MLSNSKLWGLNVMEALKFMLHSLAGLCILSSFRQQPPKSEIHSESLAIAINIFKLV